MAGTDLPVSDWAATRGDKWAAHVDAMEATLAPVDAPLLDALQLDRAYRIAEVGSGGGATALAIARRAPAGTTIHGFDISPTLVDIARERVPADAPHVAFALADMGTAAPEQPYDRLVSRFGIIAFPHPASAFANLLRWLRRGGRSAFAVWGPPADNPWISTVRDAVARVVTIPPAEPDAPGAFRYADIDTLLALLDAAGFAELEVRDWRGSLPLGGNLPPADAARFALSAFASFGDLLATAATDARDEAHRSLTAQFAAHHDAGAVRLPAHVRIVTGTTG
jgi:SAM-dependent methyltransferase